MISDCYLKLTIGSIQTWIGCNMKTKHFYSILVVAVVSLLTFTAFSVESGDSQCKTNKDRIKFSHSFHNELVECAGCHSSVKGSKSLSVSLLPKKEDCASCHDVDDSDNCVTCHYEDVYEPLVPKKSKLIFDHNFHLTKYQSECSECHKGLDEVDYSIESSLVNPPMENCFQCHSERKVATNTCEACHTSTTDLIPVDHRVKNFVKLHKFAAERRNANCVMCHDNNTCESCHSATNRMVENNSEVNFFRPYESGVALIDGAKHQKLNKIHDLNYRYTHGIDSKGKTSECQTCHQVETFCVECHSSTGGDFAMGGIMPSTHKKPGFFTIGVGSGGGEHAKLAKRDIERCASCHDVNGNDPNCITCHMDNDGIKGTNPKTHVRNYMSNIKGDWHFDDGAVCFNCHTDSGARFRLKATGFCSYCHKN